MAIPSRQTWPSGTSSCRAARTAARGNSGGGAMGVTYRAFDTSLRTEVALKVIRAEQVANEDTRRRFQREARAAAKIRHPNVASVLYLGEQGEEFFYAMEFIAGRTLAELLKETAGPLPPVVAVALAAQAAAALNAAHKHAVVHRDLKPGNLMLLEGGALDHEDERTTAAGNRLLKVIDFGLARSFGEHRQEESFVTQAFDGFVGTPAYASPEQCVGGSDLDGRSDLYSLGVILWQMLAGRLPFAGGVVEVLGKHQFQPPPAAQLAHVPAPVVALVTGLLAKDPAERQPQTAGELRTALDRCLRELTGTTATALPPSFAPTDIERTCDEAATTPTVGTTLPPRGPALAVSADLPVPAGEPDAVSAAREDAQPRHPAAVPRRRPRFAWATGAVLFALAVGGAVAWWRHAAPATAGSGPAAVTEKSIAVLPFDNLSADKDNAYFAEGIQDEILTDLAKVADLKVISRTSVMAYGPGHAGNVREIGLALGVAHLLEGSVQRAAGRVRVTAQLIDARTDAQLWAEHFDRDLSDVFAIQSEMAERIAASLQARLSPGEKTAIDARPTADLAAYDLYVRAKDLVATFQGTPDWRESLFKAVGLLDEATARDPRFALAYCLAARAHDQLYFFGLDPTPARLTLEENAAAAALRLQPALGEAHLAWALLLYHGRRDYAGARRELAIARAALPNAAEVFSLTSYLDRREGHWDDAARNQERATSLDPRNPGVLNDQMVIHDMRREYRDEVRVAEAGVAAAPSDDAANYCRLIKAAALLEAGQLEAARAAMAGVPPDYDSNGGAMFTRVLIALYQKRPAEAAALVAGFKGGEYSGVNGLMTPRAWLEALVARAAGDPDRARAALWQARGIADATVRQRPDDPGALALLGEIDAGLGRKEDALREGRAAVAMRPVSADAMDGPGLATALALIYAWTGEADAAMTALAALEKTPGGPDAGQLRFDPMWDPVRGKAGFAEMLARLDPHLAP